MMAMISFASEMACSRSGIESVESVSGIPIHWNRVASMAVQRNSNTEGRLLAGIL